MGEHTEFYVILHTYVVPQYVVRSSYTTYVIVLSFSSLPRRKLVGLLPNTIVLRTGIIDVHNLLRNIKKWPARACHLETPVSIDSDILSWTAT